MELLHSNLSEITHMENHFNFDKMIRGPDYSFLFSFFFTLSFGFYLSIPSPETNGQKSVRAPNHDFIWCDEWPRMLLASSSFTLTGSGGICFITSGRSFKLVKNENNRWITADNIYKTINNAFMRDGTFSSFPSIKTVSYTKGSSLSDFPLNIGRLREEEMKIHGPYKAHHPCSKN